MNSACAICCKYLRRSSKALSTTTCGHVFHRQCLINSLGRSQTCPQCKCDATEATTTPIYLNFSADNLKTIRNLKSRIVHLRRTLEMKGKEIGRSRLTNQTLMERVATQGERVLRLGLERNQLNSKLNSKTKEAKVALDWLKDREEKIRDLEHTAKIDREAYKVRIEQMEQQDKLIKKLTARCLEFETFTRKFASEAEKLNGITTPQKARAVKDEPIQSTDNVAGRREDNCARKRKRL